MGPDDWEGKREPLELQMGESRSLEILPRRPVAVTPAGDDFPKGLDRALPGGVQRTFGRPHMLDEAEFAAWLEDSPDLLQHSPNVRHRAEHERPDHGIDRGIFKGNILGTTTENGGLVAMLGGLAVEKRPHVRVRLDPDPLDPERKVPEVDARSWPDLEDPALESGEQPSLSLRHGRLIKLHGLVQ